MRVTNNFTISFVKILIACPYLRSALHIMTSSEPHQFHLEMQMQGPINSIFFFLQHIMRTSLDEPFIFVLPIGTL